MTARRWTLLWKRCTCRSDEQHLRAEGGPSGSSARHAPFRARLARRTGINHRVPAPNAAARTWQGRPGRLDAVRHDRPVGRRCVSACAMIDDWTRRAGHQRTEESVG